MVQNGASYTMQNLQINKSTLLVQKTLKCCKLFSTFSLQCVDLFVFIYRKKWNEINNFTTVIF